MNSKLLVIKSIKTSEKFNKDIELCLLNVNYEIYDYKKECKDRRILFAIELNSLGYDLDLLEWLNSIAHEKDFFLNSIAGIIIESKSELYTKTMSQDIILHCNFMGLSFVGHSVIEITKNYANFKTWQKTVNKSLREIAIKNSSGLVSRILEFTQPTKKNKVLALHSSSYKTSNTLGLWRLVKEKLTSLGCADVKEFHIANGSVVDCKGCTFQACLDYGKKHSCFYHDIMTESIIPAIKESDIIVWICPNYNDSVSSNMLAVINRLTVLYRQMSFHDKMFYSIIVSGSSGSDALAKQLIGALNINKGFLLPPYFSLMETANNPLEALEIEGINIKTDNLAIKINKNCILEDKKIECSDNW